MEDELDTIDLVNWVLVKRLTSYEESRLSSANNCDECLTKPIACRVLLEVDCTKHKYFLCRECAWEIIRKEVVVDNVTVRDFIKIPSKLKAV